MPKIDLICETVLIHNRLVTITETDKHRPTAVATLAYRATLVKVGWSTGGAIGFGLRVCKLYFCKSKDLVALKAELAGV